MLALLVPVLLAACAPADKPADTAGDTGAASDSGDTAGGTDSRLNTDDRDNDGFADGDDCDDLNPDVNPDADELCNGVDDDCDGTIDDNPTNEHTWYNDADGDGWGSGRSTACEAPEGTVAAGGDCDDADPNISPGEREVCDAIDNDCDDAIDDADNDLDASTGAAFHLDADGDGFGDAAETWACLAPANSVTDTSDCDDTHASVNPGAEEACDHLDNDCDGSVDWDHRVPTNYPTIQAGIDAADAGDTVCVEAGTYAENLELLGFDLSIVGTDGSLATTIDGSGVGSVVRFGGWESPATVFQGFTIVNGSADNGAGVWLDGASATLRDVVITGNECISASCNGVGLFSEGGAPVLDGVDIYANRADASAGFAGIGAWFYAANPTISDSSFDENDGETAESAYGTGLAFEASTGTVTRTTVEDNITALTGNGELRGSLSVVDSDVKFTDVSVSNNEASGGTGTAIGAAGVYEVDSGSTWSQIVISGNVAVASEIQAAGLLVESSTSTWTNVILAGNKASADTLIYGGGAAVGAESTLVLTNVTVYGNELDGLGTATEMRGAGLCLMADTTLNNVTVSGNRGNGVTQAGGIYATGFDVAVTYTNAYDNDVADWVGMDDPTGSDGNLAVDPTFTDVSAIDALDWDLHLLPGSGLIDAGDPTILDADGTVSDLGGFGGPEGSGW